METTGIFFGSAAMLSFLAFLAGMITPKAALCLVRGRTRSSIAVTYSAAAGILMVLIYLLLCMRFTEGTGVLTSIVLSGFVLVVLGLASGLAAPGVSVSFGADSRKTAAKQLGAVFLVFLAAAMLFNVFADRAASRKRPEHCRSRTLSEKDDPDPVGPGFEKTASGFYIPAYLSGADTSVFVSSYEPSPRDDMKKLEQLAEVNKHVVAGTLDLYRHAEMALPTSMALDPFEYSEATFRQIHDAHEPDYRFIRTIAFTLAAVGDLRFMQDDRSASWKLYRSVLLMGVDLEHGLGFYPFWRLHSASLTVQKITLKRLIRRFYRRDYTPVQERHILSEISSIMRIKPGLWRVLEAERTTLHKFDFLVDYHFLAEGRDRYIGFPLYKFARRLREIPLLMYTGSRAEKHLRQMLEALYGGFERGMKVGFPQGIKVLNETEQLHKKLKETPGFSDNLFSPARSFARTAVALYTTNFRWLYLRDRHLVSLYRALKLIHHINLFHEKTGTLPGSLSSLEDHTGTPLPRDAVTGENFEYVPTGNTSGGDVPDGIVPGGSSYSLALPAGPGDRSALFSQDECTIVEPR